MRLNAINLAINRMQSLRKYIGNAWTPLDLFANGEPGFWYDPSDLSTMFQDSNGTIPMQPVGTVADQPVGLILDKSRGLVGPELLVNGTFTTGITGWAETPPGVASVSGGKLVLTSASAGLTYPLVTQQLPALQVGKLYKLSFYRRNISANEGIGIQLGETAGSAGLAQIAVSTNTSGEVVSLYWLATVTTVWVTVFAKCQNAGETAEADDVSFIEIPGNHAFQATSPARPVLSARVNLLTETQDFNTAAWLDNGVTVTPNAIIAPDGTLTGDKISSTLSFFGLIQKYQLGKTVSGPIEHSAYLKKGEVDWCMLNAYVTTDIRAWFDLTNGVVGIVEGAMTASIEDAGDGWWKCSVFQTVTGMATNAGISFEPTNADGVGAIDWVAGEGLYVWGAQLAPRGQGHKYQRVKNAADYDASGFPTFLKLEGVDDGLGTTNFSMTGTNKATVFAGYANGKTGSTGTLLEFSANYMNNGGGFALLVPSLSTSNVSFGSHGTLGAGEKDAPAAPAGGLEKRVLTAYQDFATLNDYGCDYVRANSIPLTSLVGVGNTDVGAGPFGTFPAFIGSRNNAANFMNGNIYSLILAGNGYDEKTLIKTENWIHGKLYPGGVAFSPDDLFKAGEKGCWYDPSDLTTLFQDSNGTIPVTGPDVLIGKMLDKSGNGNHITATTGKPTLRRDSNGNYYLQGNGTSTAMSTPATVDLSTTNKITIFSGAAAANVGTGIICEATAAWVGSPGTYAMYVGDAYPATVAVGDAAFSNQLIGSSPGPIADQSRHVYSGLHTIPGDSSTLRTDGVSFPPGTADKGAGNFGNYTMNFMARNNGEALWLNGGVYAFILRGTESTGFEIRSTEQWIANKTGVVLA